MQDIADQFRRPPVRAERLAAEVAGDDADVVVQAFDDRGQGPHGAHADIRVKIGEMQDSEPVERVRQAPQRDGIASDLDAAGVDPASRQHAAETERPGDDGVEDVGRSKLCA